MADSTVLIALSKTGRLALLKRLYGQVLVPPHVMREVLDRGQALERPEVMQIRLGRQEGWILETTLGPEERLSARGLVEATKLDPGEAEALALAGERQIPLIVDDREARMAAERMGIGFLGTAAVLLQAFRLGHLTYDGLEQALRELVAVLWLSPSVVAEVLRRARRGP